MSKNENTPSAGETSSVIPPIGNREDPLPVNRQKANPNPPLDSPVVPWQRWLRLVLDHNPFYLLSAALMLYGIYLVSMEPRVAGEELRQLAFNFSSLQLYEILLVVTAVVLARQAVWYDSTLLVCLENLFVFLPFILIVQASLLTRGVMLVISLAASLLAFGRFSLLSRRLPGFPKAKLLMALGAVLLVINVFFPYFFRSVIELDNETWGECSHWFWILLLPIIVMAGNMVPLKNLQESKAPERLWLPLTLVGSWVSVTAVHLASMDYVNSQTFYWWQVMPLSWVMLWSVYHRCPELFPEAAGFQRVLMVMASAVTLLATDYENPRLFLVFNALNAIFFLSLWRNDRRNNLARHLLAISLAALVAGMPEWLGRHLIPDFTRGNCILFAMGMYLLTLLSLSREVWAAVIGAVFVNLSTTSFFAGADYLDQFALQNALVYLLLHSLRWNGPVTSASKALRVGIGLGWIAHSVGWGYYTEGAVMGTIMLYGLLALLVLAVAWYCLENRPPGWLFLAALLVIASGLINYAFALLRITPTGYLIVLASFLMFGAGTLLALSKSYWRKPELLTCT